MADVAAGFGTKIMARKYRMSADLGAQAQAVLAERRQTLPLGRKGSRNGKAFLAYVQQVLAAERTVRDARLKRIGELKAL